MAVGRESKTVAPREVEIVAGRAGRISAPPEGGLFVRDVEAARARAVQERVKAIEASGGEVPEELAAMAAELEIGEDDELINLVDAVTGELLAEADTEVDEVDGPTEEEVVDEEVPEPEPETEPEAEAEAEPEAEAEAEPEAEVFDVETLTVAELRTELDSLGIEHTHEDRKADLQQKLRDALQE
jgi:hypothetical protein